MTDKRGRTYTLIHVICCQNSQSWRWFKTRYDMILLQKIQHAMYGSWMYQDPNHNLDPIPQPGYNLYGYPIYSSRPYTPLSYTAKLLVRFRYLDLSLDGMESLVYQKLDQYQCGQPGSSCYGVQGWTWCLGWSHILGSIYDDVYKQYRCCARNQALVHILQLKSI